MPRGFDPPITADELLAATEGRYTYASPIFVGGQAAVFKAISSEGGTHAVKVFFPNPEARIEERTAREVATLTRLRADTLVTLEAEGHVSLRGTQCRFLATTYIEGKSLASAITGGPLPAWTVARIGIDIAEAIALLWVERIVHRDITPNNVMIDHEKNRAVLIDLGLARHIELASLTNSNEGWGTQGYCSPEQSAAQRGLTCKSDVFSLGIVLQHCLSGAHPCGGDQRRVNLGVPRTVEIAPDCPPALREVIDAMVRHSAPRRLKPAAVISALRPLAFSGGTNR
jgi:serine/threonine protein kinase